ncbi:DNA-3-methyladenine glycosylase I [Temperatibacter marinus]|uniref:DNA-3-methyladenine glycosylase I n=1 Tax=Temperatibacter marinus TaxID=1456591 RepID=A0AA52HAF8_9PROT|nr:DNA-3-methyladenine glycosylase I [Temperatibacter marinus]WND02558.1 DNA-3-methyladenine glycosylase I [Temperatibacter marinus]
MTASFQSIMDRALLRKGGEKALQALLEDIPQTHAFEEIPDDRVLSMMCRVINQAGFNWSVITKKWPQFEEAYFGFDVDKLVQLSPDEWEAYVKDKRVVRNWQKIKAVWENARFVSHISEEHGSFARFMASYGADQQIDLMAYLKKHGSRLGGNTGMFLLRFLGKDSFILSRDVIWAIRDAGVDIAENPTSKRDLTAIQATFNQWHKETGLSYTYLSRIASYSIGTDNSANKIQSELKKLGLDA